MKARLRNLSWLGAVLCAACLLATQVTAAPGKTLPFRSAKSLTAKETAFLDTLEFRAFHYFWDLSHPSTGLTPDRWPTQSFASVSATGFALTAYPIGVERGWVRRQDAATRVLHTLTHFYTARMDTARAGCAGYKGFFYHFVDRETGHRFQDVELSTMDTALLLAGVLCCQSYFDGPDTLEFQVRVLADSIYARANWQWAEVRPPMVVHGWDPEHGFLPYDWRGYNESMLVPILALGSPTFPLGREAWSYWASGSQWGSFEGYPHVGFAPLFGHQYTHVWLDFAGIQDSLMAARGIDWSINARRATYAQRAYAIRNPSKFRGYGPRLWGLTACDGPMDATLTIGGRKREFRTYAARGASFREIVDDGTVSPSAAGGSLAFAPEIVLPVLMAMRQDYGAEVFGQYGFVDALNPTLRDTVAVHHGRVNPRLGWFDNDYLGIDQGPLLCMAENYRTGLVWKLMRRNPYIVKGLRAAGFHGGWLDRTDASR